MAQTDAPAHGGDQKLNEAQAPQESWTAQVFKNMEADQRANAPRPAESAPTPSPQMTALESQGTLPNFRTSC